MCADIYTDFDRLNLADLWMYIVGTTRTMPNKTVVSAALFPNGSTSSTPLLVSLVPDRAPTYTQAVKYMDKLTPSAQAVGSINTVFLEFPSGRDDGQPVFVGHNTDVEGVRNALLRSLHLDNPDPKRPLPQRTDEKRPVFAPGSAYSFIIGGGGASALFLLF